MVKSDLPRGLHADTAPVFHNPNTDERNATLDQAVASLIDAIDQNAAALGPLSSMKQTIDHLDAIPVVGRNHLLAAVTREPAAVALLLREVNARYADPMAPSITNIGVAVDLMGGVGVRALLEQLVRVEVERWRWDDASQHLRRMWTNTVYTALSARALAQRHGRVDPELAFSAAMIHNIGEPLLIQYLSEHAPASHLDHAHIPGIGHSVAATHQKLGAHLLRRWGMPAPIIRTTLRHHGRFEDPLTAIVAAAWQSALRYGYVYLGAHPDPSALRVALNRLQLSSTVFDDVTHEIMGDLNTMLSSTL